MACILADGFDSYANTNVSPGGLTDGGWTLSKTSTVAISMVAGRFGGQALRLRNSSGNPTVSRYFDGGATSASLTMNFGFYYSNFQTTFPFMGLLEAGTAHLSFFVLADGSIRVDRGGYSGNPGTGTQLGVSSAGVVTLSTWVSLIIEIEIHDTTGRITIYADDINDPPVLNLTNIDTRNGGTGVVDQLSLGYALNLSHDYRFDDLWIGDTSSDLADFIRCETRMASADGANLDLTPSTGTDHFAVVDDAPCDTADFLSGTTVGDFDELELQNMATNPVFVKTVQPFLHCAKTDVASRSINVEVDSNGTVSTGPDISLSAGLRASRLIDLDPDGSVAWTKAKVDGLKLRPKVAV